MARSFARASNEYLQQTAWVPSMPFAMGCWAKLVDIVNVHTLMAVANSTTQDAHYISAQGNIAGDPLYARTFQSGGPATAITTSGYSAGVWHYVVALFVSAADRRVLLDNGSKGTNATNKTPTALDNVAIGRLTWSTPANALDGYVAEPAIWNLSVWPGATAADKANEFERLAVPALAKGYSPLFFPLGLVAYWPLGGLLSSPNPNNDAAGDRDIIGGYHMTPYNTPSVADHPSVFYKSRKRLVFPAAAAGGVVPYWVFPRGSQMIGGGVA